MPLRRPFSVQACLVLLATALCSVDTRAEPWELLARVEVDSQGLFVDKLFSGKSAETFSGIRLMNAPTWGVPLKLSREEIAERLAKVLPGTAANLTGAPFVLISRRAEKLTDKELLKVLSDELSPNSESDRGGELELRLIREWKPISVPADHYKLRILDKPATGLAPSFMVRFEILSDSESIGIYSVSLQARLYRDVWVARSAIRANTNLPEAELAQERRDVINNLREPIWSGERNSAYRIKEPLAAGAVLLNRAVQKRPVVFRGKQYSATLNDGLLSVSARLEVLEDGAPGQIVRARNPLSKKEIHAKVTNEGTLEIPF